MTLFMKKFKKYVKKKKFSKGENKFKSKTKRTCYNCGKHDHFIANYPFEHRNEDDEKKKYKPYKKDKDYKRSDKPYKKKFFGEAHIGQEYDSMMRAPTPIVTVWQPWLSRESLLQVSLSSHSSIK
jgi:hypothetical protein